MATTEKPADVFEIVNPHEDHGS